MRYGRNRGGGGGRSFGERREHGGGGGFRQTPVKVGEEYDVQITDVAAKGDGIARIEGFIIFVPGTTHGDNCRIRIKEVARRFAVGEKVGEGSGAPAVSEAYETESEPSSLEEEETEKTE